MIPGQQPEVVTSSHVEKSWVSAGGPGTFDLAGITNTVGAPFLRVFCEGRDWEMPAPSWFDHVSTIK